MTDLSLQERYAPGSACFGCGPANDKGLRIRSFARGDEYVAEWRAEPHHEAFPGMLNGGIIGALLDCHSNWAAAEHLRARAGHERPPCTVTAAYSVKLLRPTPTDGHPPLRTRRRINRRPRRRRGRTGRRREDLRHLPRHFRRRSPRPSGLPPLATRRTCKLSNNLT